jgi:hypothetical protein
MEIWWAHQFMSAELQHQDALMEGMLHLKICVEHKKLSKYSLNKFLKNKKLKIKGKQTFSNRILS